MRIAARRVAQRLARERHVDLEPADIEHHLDRLLWALEDESGDLEAERQPVSELTLYQRLLDLLYREVLHDWSAADAPPSSGEMLEHLRSFERVRESLAPRPDERFASPWPQDAELVVELAHDLRSPLTSIIFLAETLRRGQGGELSELQRRQMGIIYSAALSLVSMASDVIELARGGRRLMERRPSPFSIAELVESTLDILRPVVEEKGLAMHTRAPEVDQRLGHPVALSRVLLNLASNALKFTDKGYVEISARATGETTVEFTVADTGPGLDPGATDELFEPLRREPQSRRFGFSGSGLGLAICRHLVTAMGGDLRYETSRGAGTRFFFELDLPPVRLS